MIKGVGTDVCSAARLGETLAKFGEQFEVRLLTPEERESKVWDAKKLARRWALKEAVAKALGTGIGATVGFQDIQVSYCDLGAPVVRVRGFEGVRWHVSVSDDADIVFAVAVAEEA